MRTTLLICLSALFCTTGIAQPKEKKSVVIGKMTTKENALLILNPPEANQGVILPQLSSAQRTSINPSSPSENGLIVFDTDLKSFLFWSDGAWVKSHADNLIETKFLSIDPLSFRGLKASNSIRPANMVVFETENTFVTVSQNNQGEQIMASLNLPHASVMKELTVYYMDNDSRTLKVKLMRKSLPGNNEEIISWESSGSSSEVNAQSFQSFNGLEVIDLEKYSYRLLVIFDTNNDDAINEPADATQRLYGVKIKYQE